MYSTTMSCEFTFQPESNRKHVTSLVRLKESKRSPRYKPFFSFLYHAISPLKFSSPSETDALAYAFSLLLMHSTIAIVLESVLPFK